MKRSHQNRKTKLKLDTEVVRALSTDNLANVVGGSVSGQVVGGCDTIRP